MYERIRELGLLRAVGQTRSQLRSMVRWESVIIAVFGTIGGILVGLFLGWGILEVTARSQDFPAPYTIPFGQIIGVLIVGAVVGVVAGWRPARRRRSSTSSTRSPPSDAMQDALQYVSDKVAIVDLLTQYWMNVDPARLGTGQGDLRARHVGRLLGSDADR